MSEKRNDYFDCGAVTPQVLDVSSARLPHTAAKSLYFTVNDLEAAHRRATALKCLSSEQEPRAASRSMRPPASFAWYI